MEMQPQTWQRTRHESDDTLWIIASDNEKPLRSSCHDMGAFREEVDR
jgi:hypothetical protein